MSIHTPRFLNMKVMLRMAKFYLRRNLRGNKSVHCDVHGCIAILMHFVGPRVWFQASSLCFATCTFTASKPKQMWAVFSTGIGNYQEGCGKPGRRFPLLNRVIGWSKHIMDDKRAFDLTGFFRTHCQPDCPYVWFNAKKINMIEIQARRCQAQKFRPASGSWQTVLMNDQIFVQTEHLRQQNFCIWAYRWGLPWLCFRPVERHGESQGRSRGTGSNWAMQQTVRVQCIKWILLPNERRIKRNQYTMRVPIN